jgi:GTPase SAR1 family protein
MSEQFKLVLVGNSGVGKTSLINFLRLGNPDFHGTKPTVGVSFANYVRQIVHKAKMRRDSYKSLNKKLTTPSPLVFFSFPRRKWKSQASRRFTA